MNSDIRLTERQINEIIGLIFKNVSGITLSELHGIEKIMLRRYLVIERKRAVLTIDDYGRYIHSYSGFIFHPTYNIVTGRLDFDGNVCSLTQNDIDDCIALGFSHIGMTDDPREYIEQIEDEI